MDRFKIVSEYKMMGDQPKAVETLASGIMEGKKAQTLMGVTGSGKTFTMANIIEQVQKPTLVISHNKTLAAQLHRYLYREGLGYQRGDREAEALGDGGTVGAAGRYHRRQCILHLRIGKSDRL